MEKSVNNSRDVSNFFEILAGNFAGVVQYNKDNRFSKAKTTVTIDTLCDVMLDEDIGPAVDRLAVVNNIILYNNGQKCLDYKYDKMLIQYRNISWDSEVSEGGKFEF